MTKVKVQQELLWMIISGYKHEKKKKKKKKERNMHLSKTKMGKRELILEANHSMRTV